jgi:GT2 family glycosyltransferase
VLNPDTSPAPGALAALVDRLKRGDCDAVGCTLYLPDGTVQLHGGRWRPWLARAVAIGQSSALDASVDPAAVERAQNYLSGASMMVGRHYVECAGPMREDYFLYCEEVEWFLRGAARGLRLGFAPDARVLHYQGTTTGNPVDIKSRSRMPIYLDERNKILATRDCFPVRLPVAAAASLVLLFLRYARRGAWRQFRYALSGWWAGILGERGKPAWVGN